MHIEPAKLETLLLKFPFYYDNVLGVGNDLFQHSSIFRMVTWH